MLPEEHIKTFYKSELRLAKAYLHLAETGLDILLKRAPSQERDTGLYISAFSHASKAWAFAEVLGDESLLEAASGLMTTLQVELGRRVGQ